MSEYFFPEAFVEDGLGEGRVICLTGTRAYVSPARGLAGPECGKVFSSVPFEKLVEFLDLEKSCFLKDVIIVYMDEGDRYRGFYVRKGESVRLLEVSGSIITIHKKEGEQVEAHEKIGFIVTNKREVRVIKSPVKGILLAVIDLTWESPEKVIMVLTSEQPREIIVGKNP
ncbi:MAG: DUF2118 domain-containing protein [Thermosphaera sp.]